MDTKETGSGWTIIPSEQAWESYCRQYEEERGWQQIEWKSKPAEYPCMISSYSPHLYSVVNAFVYVSQAQQLLNVAGHTKNQPSAGPGRSQVNFNRYVRANLLAIWRSLRPDSQGYAAGQSAEQAQDAVIEALSDCDRWDAAAIKERANMNGNDVLSQLETNED